MRKTGHITFITIVIIAMLASAMSFVFAAGSGSITVGGNLIDQFAMSKTIDLSDSDVDISITPAERDSMLKKAREDAKTYVDAAIEDNDYDNDDYDDYDKIVEYKAQELYNNAVNDLLIQRLGKKLDARFTFVIEPIAADGSEDNAFGIGGAIKRGSFKDSSLTSVLFSTVDFGADGQVYDEILNEYMAGFTESKAITDLDTMRDGRDVISHTIIFDLGQLCSSDDSQYAWGENMERTIDKWKGWSTFLGAASSLSDCDVFWPAWSYVREFNLHHNPAVTYYADEVKADVISNAEFDSNGRLVSISKPLIPADGNVMDSDRTDKEDPTHNLDGVYERLKSSMDTSRDGKYRFKITEKAAESNIKGNTFASNGESKIMDVSVENGIITDIDFYDSAGSETAPVFTNVLKLDEKTDPEEETASLDIYKRWAGDTERVRPEKVKVDVYADGDFYKTVEISKSDNWHITLTVPAGKTYSAVERTVPDYKSSVDTAKTGIITITNTYSHPEPEEPEIRTTATDNSDGDKVLEASEKAEVKDVVEYQNLMPGETYTMSGQLVKKSDQSVIATAETIFTASESGSGTVEMVFTFDASALAGEKLVAFETCKDGEGAVATHADINDENQTVEVEKKDEPVPVIEPVSVRLAASKKLESTNTADAAEYAGEFTFRLDGAAGLIRKVSNDKYGMIDFGSVEFCEAGVYKYAIKEIHGYQAGIIYDDSEKSVEITVEEKDGSLEVTGITVDGTAVSAKDGVIDAGAFVNTKRAVRIEKKWSGDPFANTVKLRLSWTIEDKDYAEMVDELHKAITVKGVDEVTIIEIFTYISQIDKGSRMIAIEKLLDEYELEKGKSLEEILKKALTGSDEEYVLSIIHNEAECPSSLRLQAESDGKVYLDLELTKDTLWTAVISGLYIPSDAEVEELTDVSGWGTSDVSGSADDGFTVINTKVKDVSLTDSLEVRKSLSGRSWRDSDSFDFALIAEDEKTPLPEGCRTSGDIRYAALQITNKETAAGDSAYSKGFGDITYTFADMDRDADGNVKDTTFTYHVRELVAVESGHDRIPGITYDDSRYEYKVTVGYNSADSTLEIKSRSLQDADGGSSAATASDGTETMTAAFSNSYDAKTTHYHMTAEKSLQYNGVNMTPEDGSYTFVLTPAGVNAASAPMPEGSEGTGKDRSYKASNAGHRIGFSGTDGSGLTFDYTALTQAGFTHDQLAEGVDFGYEIYEVIPEGAENAGDGTYRAVTKNGSGYSVDVYDAVHHRRIITVKLVTLSDNTEELQITSHADDHNADYYYDKDGKKAELKSGDSAYKDRHGDGGVPIFRNSHNEYAGGTAYTIQAVKGSYKDDEDKVDSAAKGAATGDDSPLGIALAGLIAASAGLLLMLKRRVSR